MREKTSTCCQNFDQKPGKNFKCKYWVKRGGGDRSGAVFFSTTWKKEKRIVPKNRSKMANVFSKRKKCASGPKVVWAAHVWCSLPIETCMRRRLRLNGARMISLMHIMDAVSHRALQQGAQWASVCLGIEGMHWGIGYATRYWVCIRVCMGVGFLRVSIVESAPCHCFSYRLLARRISEWEDGTCWRGHVSQHQSWSGEIWRWRRTQTKTWCRSPW